MSHFKLVSRVDLQKCPLNTQFEESDFARITPDGNFIQMRYFETEESKQYVINPGIFSIVKRAGEYQLEPTTFTNDNLLETFVHTEDISNKIDCFFRKIDVYKELGYDVPQRKMLMYGPPGGGKSTTIAKVARQYVKDGQKNCVVIWPTSKFESYEVKDF